MKTVRGTYKDGILTGEDGEIIPCITYKHFKEEINGFDGFFNLKYSAALNVWIIFQAVAL